ncbi:hypothetical protein ACA081_00125 [Candidatus Hodgkinia cicadicola]
MVGVRGEVLYRGLISRSYIEVLYRGLISYCSSLDQIGIISKIGADCAYLSSFLFGKDKKDWSVLNLPVPKYNLYTTCISTEAVILRRHAPCRNINWTYSLSLFTRIGIKIIEEKLKYI